MSSTISSADERHPPQAASSTAASFDVHDTVEGLHVDLRRHGHQGWVVTAAGELDVATAPVLDRTLRGAVGEGAVRIVLDLDQVTFMDSTGLAVLVWTHKHLAARAGELVLVCHDAACLKVIRVTGLNRVFRFAPSVADGLSPSPR